MPELSTGQLGGDALGDLVLGGELVFNARLTEELLEVGYRDAADIPSNYVRETELLLEASYRDVLVAEAATITQEVLEASYRDVLHLPVNAVRFTQQTVELLYLLPSSSDPFDDCGHFTGNMEWEARLYDHMDPSTGKRKAYGPDGEDLGAVIEELNFEIQERGGYGGGSFQFLADWEDSDLDGTERVDVWLWDEPAYRGYVRIAQKDLAAVQSVRPQLYGMVAILDQWIVKRKYAYGCATDVSIIARDIALDYVKVTGRFPNVSLDMSVTVGATLKEFDGRGKSVAQCFNELADYAPNQVIWGNKMDAGRPVPGDTLYFSPRPTTTAYVVPVGDNVQSFTYPQDTHDIVNSLAPLTGGPVSQPNLALNGSFEELKPASEDHGNLLLNHSFESDAGSHPYWTRSGPDPTVKYSGHVTAHGAARTGNQWAELDENNEAFSQTVQVIASTRYEVSCWARLEDGTISQSGIMEVFGYNSASVLVTPPSLFVSLIGLTATYQRFVVDVDLSLYPTVRTLKIKVTSYGGSAANNGILIDDCGIYEYCESAQEYWRIRAAGAATIADTNWASEAVTPRTGAYTAHVKCTTIALPADYAELYYLADASPSVAPNERYTVIVHWHTNGAGTPGANVLSIGAISVNSSGDEGTTFESSTVTFPGTVLSTWQMTTFDLVTENTTAKLKLFIRIRTNENIYIDDVMLVQGDIPTEVRDSRGYWSADTYERYITVTDALLVGSYALAAGVSGSITTYGTHEEEASNDLVTDLASALTYAAGQFNAKALPKVEAQLTIYGARDLIAQEGKVRLVNLPSAPAALFPSRSSYTITAEAIVCSVELGNQRPDLASLLLLTSDRARKGLT